MGKLNQLVKAQPQKQITPPDATGVEDATYIYSNPMQNL